MQKNINAIFKERKKERVREKRKILK